MSRTAQYDRDAILKAYIAGEKTTVIAAMFGCHDSTPGKIAKAAGVKTRRRGNDRNIISFVAEHIHAPAKRIAEHLGTTVGYVNKLKSIARKRIKKAT